MLRAIPKGWWTLKYELLHDDIPVGLIEFSFGSEGATITVDGEVFSAHSHGWFTKSYTLESAGAALANAENLAFSGRFIIGSDGRSYTLEKDSGLLNRNYVLIDDTGIIGTIKPDGMFSSKSTIDLPSDIPTHTQAFMFWLVALLWKRSSDASAVS